MATDFSSPKVGVDELRKGPVTLGGKGKTVGGFMGVARMGPINTPTKCVRPSEAIAIFGAKMDPTESYLMYDVDLFFRNGGKECWISRVAHVADAAKSTVNLVNSTPATATAVTASSEGTHADGGTVQTIRRTTRIGTLPAAATVTAGAKTSILLGTGASRVQVGDLIRIASTTGGETGTLTFIVTGKNGNTLYFASTSPTEEITVGTPSDGVVELLTFDMIVRDATGVITGNFKNLRVSPLSSNFIDTVVNGTYLTPVATAWNTNLNVAAFDSRPADQTVVLAGGDDGLTNLDDDDYIGGGVGTGTGLNAWDSNSNFDMLSVCGVRDTTPLARTEAVIRALLDYAELRKSFVAIVNVPVGFSRANSLTYAGTTVNSYTSYAEGYWKPWLKVLHPVTGLVALVPSSGARQGVLARTHSAQGNAKAAGGIEDGKILGILGLEENIQELDYDVLYPARINCAQAEDGQGFCFNGNITLDPTGEVIESGIRFYLLKLAKDLKTGLAWTKFKFNTAETRARVVRNVSSRLRDDWRKKQLDGAKESDAYFVVCDESNNGPDVRAARTMNVQIGVNVSHSAEFIPVTLELDTRAIDALAATVGT